MAKTSAAQQRAVHKYVKNNYDRLELSVPKGEKVTIQQAGGENKYEINISSATLDRPIEETASTLLHEMVHEHCMETGIKRKSRGVQANLRPHVWQASW